MSDVIVPPRIKRILRARGMLPALEAELLAAGVDHYDLVMGGKHPKLKFDWGGVTRVVPLAFSGHSRGRARQNGVTQLRRLLRGSSPE